MVSSIIKTFTRFLSVSFVIVEFAIFAESRDVKFVQLIDVEFKNLYTVSLAKFSLCLPVSSCTLIY